MVTTDGFSAQVDQPDNVAGYYFSTARQTGESSPEYDDANGMWALKVAGTSASTD
ncbi:MAG: hypothetical protein K9K37_08105 [Desulfocapsa sp.]|nr:hypothetical protein [Desulfocapsa sp.]